MVVGLARELYGLGVAPKSGVDRFGGDAIVVKYRGAEHDECAPFMIIGVIEFDVPGGESGVECVVIAVQVEACFLYEDNVRVFGEVRDVCQYLAASCFARCLWRRRKGR